MAEPNEDLLKLAKDVLRQEGEAVSSLAVQLDTEIIRVAHMILDCHGHILITGAGTSRAIAARCAHLMACCGTPALFISAADSLHGGAGAITADDIVYIISKGGQSREINNFAGIARDRGARIIAHTENPQSPLAEKSDAVLKVKAPDGVDPYGMIATGSSLVNGAVCDALCVVLLKLRGYTREQFGATHPEGAVGEKLRESK